VDYWIVGIRIAPGAWAAQLGRVGAELDRASVYCLRRVRMALSVWSGAVAVEWSSQLEGCGSVAGGGRILYDWFLRIGTWRRDIESSSSVSNTQELNPVKQLGSQFQTGCVTAWMCGR